MKRLVVIDDCSMTRNLLSLRLSKAGYEVTAFATVDLGMKEILARPPDAVLLDLEMAGKDGVACLREIRASPRIEKLPVLMVSAHPVREVIVRVAKLGVQGIIVKSDKIVPEILERLSVLLTQPSAPNNDAASLVRGPSLDRPVPGSPLLTTHEPAPTHRLVSPADAGPGQAAPVMTEPPVAVDEEWTSVPVESATEQLRALKPLVSRDAVQAHINAASELRAMGPAARHALSVSRSDSSSIEAVAKAIKQDQALSLKVLKLANSPLYSTGDRVETVAKAVARIGIAQIHEAVVSMSVMEEFGNASLASRIHSDWFWEHSIAVALIASRINHQRKGRVDNDSMFTAGLLHDLGRMLFATHLGESYATVLETADRLGLPLETIESRLLLVNHADLSDQLLRAWKFPPDLISPIALHHLSLGNIRRAAPRLVEEVSVLALANRLAHALLLGCSGNDAVYPLEEFLGALSLDGAQLAQLLADIPDQATDLKCGMFAAGSGAPGKSFLEDARSRLGVDMRPLPVALTPGTDSVAILAARLALQANGEPPNLAIVRVTTPRDRSPLMDLLKDSELRAGAQALPCLVVASTPNCLFAPGMLGQRRVEQVVVPLRLNRLFAAIRALLASVPQSQAA